MLVKKYNHRKNKVVISKINLQKVMDIRQDNDEHDETEMGVGNTVNTNELGSIFTPLMIQECSL